MTMNWDQEHFLRVLNWLRVRRGDTTTIEVKKAKDGLPKDISRTLCAFANMPDGGTIILGVNEKDNFSITGIDDISAYEQALTDINRNTVKPAPYLNFETLQVEGNTVLIVRVSPLRPADKPAETGGTSYLRQADGDYPMHSHELQMFEIEKLHNLELKQWDMESVPNTSISDLDQELLTRYLQQCRAKQRRLASLEDDEILRQNAVITEHGSLTLAGLYAMGFYPQGRFPTLTVTAAVQLGDRSAPRQIRDKQDFTGPIPVLLDDAIEWVNRNLSLFRYEANGHMRERSELPLTAVRELLANALVHRDLSPLTMGIGKSIQIRLKPNCLLIQSPGGLRGISLAQLTSTEHAQVAVNQRVYGICKLLQSHDGTSIIEGEGGGITEVFRAAKGYGLPEPTLTDTGVSFSALLWRPEPEQDPLAIPEPTNDQRSSKLIKPNIPPHNSNQLTGTNTSLVQSALADGPLSIEQISQHTGLAPHQVRYVLKKLISQNQAEMLGQRGSKSTTYKLTQEYPHP